MPLDIPLVLNSITYASMLALASIGLTATYLTTKVPNFAQGSFLMVGAYTTLLFSLGFNWNPYLTLPISALVGGIAGLLVYLFAIYPLKRRGANVMTLMVATLAISILFIGIMNIVADVYEDLGIRSRDVGISYLDFRIDNLPMRGIHLVAPLLTLGIAGSMHLILTYTKIGIAFRATVENPDLARAMGINTDLVFALSWLTSGSLGALGGSLYPLFLRIPHPNAGDDLLPSIFAASIVGGLQNIYGGLVGGYIIGLSEKIVTRLLSDIWPGVAVYQYVVSMAIFVAVLLLAPRGVIGLLRRP